MKTGKTTQRDFAMSEQSGYELIMPFLPVQSRGGPYDDHAYAAGYEMGALDTLLAQSTAPIHEVTIHAQNVEQADLIAMRYKYIVELSAPDATNTWRHLKLRRAEDQS